MDRIAVAALTLIDGGVEIPIRPLNATSGDPIACRTWDLGSPEVRITSTPNPGADGVTESGGFTGARTVTMDLLIRGDAKNRAGGHDPYWYINQLTKMCHPARRPLLKIQRNDESSAGRAWFLSLRGDPWSLTYDRASAGMINLQLTFVAASGAFESDLWTVSSSTVNTVAATDWHFPATFPKGFGATSGAPKVIAEVLGTSPISPVLYVSGPARNPHLIDDLGQEFSFQNLVLVSGQTVRIDMNAGTVLVASPDMTFDDSTSDVFHTVDFEESTFWVWPPGTRTVSMLSDSGSFAVQWRNRQLSI